MFTIDKVCSPKKRLEARLCGCNRCVRDRKFKAQAYITIGGLVFWFFIGVIIYKILK